MVADYLFVRPTGNDNRAMIVVVNADGELLGPPETLDFSELAERAREFRVCVMLPAEDVIGCIATVPVTSAARIRQMLPFSLEDEFVGNVEELHFIAGERNTEGALAVSVIEKNRLETWLERLSAAGIEAKALCSDADAVPDTPGTVTLFIEGRRILGRRPGGAPFAFTELSLPELWRLLAAEEAENDGLNNTVLFADPETLHDRQAEIDALRSETAHLEIKQLADGCLPRLAANLVHQPGINLLQGKYAPRSNYAALARPWRAAAALLVVWLGAILVGEAATVFKLSRDEARLTEAIGAVCAASYSSTQLNSCRLESLRRLDATGQSSAAGDAGYLAILALVADAGGTAVTMESMQFRDGVLSLVFLAPNAPFVDTFSQAITASGHFQVIDPSMSQEANGLRTRLRIAPVSQ